MPLLFVVIGVTSGVAGLLMLRHRDSLSGTNFEMKRGLYPGVTRPQSDAAVLVVAVGFIVGGIGSVFVGAVSFLIA